MNDILTFTTPENRWLSNMAYVNITFKGIVYNSVENFYQAMKYSDDTVRKYISKLAPHEAKAYSKSHKMTSDLFEDSKLAIMLYAQREKYKQEPFRSKLIETGHCHLEEGNWWNDKFWGVDIKTREGENFLGKAIMIARSEIGWT